MKLKNIIFDWDGTLGMTLHLWLAGYRRGMENQGHEYCDATLASEFFYEHDKGAIKYPHVDFAKLVGDAYGYIEAHLHTLALYEMAEETLARLRENGTQLALVTSSPRKLLMGGLKVHNLEKYFSSIIAGDENFEHKPHPAPFNETLRRLEIHSAETLIIGDARTDIIAGQAARTKTCLFTPNDNQLFHNFDELSRIGADFTISSLTDIIDLI